jgi:phage shock protein A
MRDSATAVERAKRALALAIAQDQQEGRRLEAITAQIADLEVRAIAALDGERNDLAQEAAESIAALEADRDAAITARALFASEITRLKRQVANAEKRITELDRGRRIARAAEAVRGLRRGGVEAARPYEATLPEAENTLKRLRERQQEAQAADDALADIDAASGPLATAERAGGAGFRPAATTHCRRRPCAPQGKARARQVTSQPTRKHSTTRRLS